jgi:hypothetical protein
VRSGRISIDALLVSTALAEGAGAIRTIPTPALAAGSGTPYA